MPEHQRLGGLPRLGDRGGEGLKRRCRWAGRSLRSRRAPAPSLVPASPNRWGAASTTGEPAANGAERGGWSGPRAAGAGAEAARPRTRAPLRTPAAAGSAARTTKIPSRPATVPPSTPSDSTVGVVASAAGGAAARARRGAARARCGSIGESIPSPRADSSPRAAYSLGMASANVAPARPAHADGGHQRDPGLLLGRRTVPRARCRDRAGQAAGRGGRGDPRHMAGSPRDPARSRSARTRSCGASCRWSTAWRAARRASRSTRRSRPWPRRRSRRARRSSTTSPPSAPRPSWPGWWQTPERTAASCTCSASRARCRTILATRTSSPT